MRSNRTCHVSVDGRPIPPIQALGVADVLRVELAPYQVRWFLDEVRELRNALEAQDLAAPSQRDVPADLRELGRIASELQLDEDGASVLGPAPLMSELIRGTTRHVVDELVEGLAQHPSRAATKATELRTLAKATSAWVETYVALLAIEWFEVAA